MNLITIFHKGIEKQIPRKDFKSEMEKLESELDTVNRRLLQKNWDNLEKVKYADCKTALDQIQY